MGIVLKRRDNAPIVKEICSGIIDYLINHKDPDGAKNYTIKCLQDMFNGKYNIKYFLQSRTLKLKESYKDWKKIAHVYLANKIMERDPGNTPQSGDRIEFAVINIDSINKKDKLLQSDIIETPKYILENNLQINYLFYLTNQIMNPALQFLELVDKNVVNIFNEFIYKYSNSSNSIYKCKSKFKTEEDYKNQIIKLIKDINLYKSKYKINITYRNKINKLLKDINNRLNTPIYNKIKKLIKDINFYKSKYKYKINIKYNNKIIKLTNNISSYFNFNN